MKQNIIIYKNNVLTTPCEEVVDIEKESIKQLANDMFETMNGIGLGLSANQIGVSKQVIVVDTTELKEKHSNRLVLINPEIEIIDTTKTQAIEGCLSFPTVFVTLYRPSGIVVHYTDLNGNRQSLSVAGYTAKCIQHEVEHLSGKTFIDGLPRKFRRTILSKHKHFLKL